MAVVAAFDDASRFRRSSSVGAYPGLTPRRYDSGEISRNVLSHNRLITVPQYNDTGPRISGTQLSLSSATNSESR